MSVFEAVLTSETKTLQVIRAYESALNQYSTTQSESDLQKMMQAQDAMDANQAWDYSAEIKTILSKLGIHDTTKEVSELSGGQQKKSVLRRHLLNNLIYYF